jgi:hypothetical protein
MNKLTKKELEDLILEEIRDLEEGVWDRLKARASGVGSAIMSPFGAKGQSYQRGKAASVLKSAAMSLISVKEEFENNVTGLFQDIAVGSEIADLRQDLKNAVNKIEEASTELQELSLKVKNIKSFGKGRTTGFKFGHSYTEE